jgi:hypothetical protein
MTVRVLNCLVGQFGMLESHPEKLWDDVSYCWSQWNLASMLSHELNVLGEVAPKGHGLLGVEGGADGYLSHVCA